MKPRASVSVLMQVALLAVFAVVASQAVSFAVILTTPPPRPAGFSIAAAADALQGRPAVTSDGRALRRRVAEAPPNHPSQGGPLEGVLAAGLAQRLNLPPAQVRVWLNPEDGGVFRRPPQDGAARRVVGQTAQSFTFTRRIDDGEAAAPIVIREAVTGEAASVLARRAEAASAAATGPVSAGSVHVITTRDGPARFSVQADRLTFAPFSASARLPDGRWATVEPPRGWIAPWQARLLISLLITALLLAPVVWLMARRLTRPIRVFAQAAERLGADPEAEPLAPSGPSEVRTAIAAFNDMQASIRAHMRQRTQTIAAIAHDLRTPLTRLRFRAEQAPDALRDRMAADVEEMDALIAQAMAFVRGETTPERRERLDLAALAADCVAGFAETGATALFSGEPAMVVQGDPAALRRAVGNLIDNGLKYGGVARVSASIEDGQAVIVVADEGPGLPLNELETAFEPFQRGERSRNRETGGAGLGLTVARQAARAAGGEVTLANRPGGGLEARLSLPLL